MSRKKKLFAWSKDDAALYLVKTHAGDEFLERIEGTKWEAVKLHFHWTRDRAAAQRFTKEALSKVFHRIVAAYSGPGIELA